MATEERKAGTPCRGRPETVRDLRGPACLAVPSSPFACVGGSLSMAAVPSPGDGFTAAALLAAALLAGGPALASSSRPLSREDGPRPWVPAPQPSRPRAILSGGPPPTGPRPGERGRPWTAARAP